MTAEEIQEECRMSAIVENYTNSINEGNKPHIPPYNSQEILKSKDLMTGNWVVWGIILEGKEYDVELKKVKGYEINDLEFEEKHQLSKRQYYPILLTREILEKNGFCLYEDIWFKPGIPFNIKKLKDEWFIYNWGIKIKYVHELQTALWLGKVDNDIIL